MSNRESMNRDLSAGFLFGFIERYSNLIVQFIVTMVLARFLDPAQFGVVATIMVIIFFFNLLGEMGLGPAIIYYKELLTREIRGLFLLCLLGGGVLYVLFSTSAFLIADFFGNDIYLGVVPLMGVMIFFSVVSIVPDALLRREKRFAVIALVTLTSALISGAIACYLAYQGYGVYALVWKSIIHTCIRLALLGSLAGWCKMLGRFSFSGVKTVFGFSSYQFLFNFLNYFSRNSDKILIAKFIGETAVGLYDMAYRLMMLPIQNIAGIAGSALQPVYSTYGQREIVESYNDLVKKIAFLGMLVGIYILLMADRIIHVLYGPGWEGSAIILQCLVPFLVIQIVLATTGGIWQTLGQTRSLFHCGVFSSVTSVAAIAAGVALENLPLVALFLSLASLLNFIQCFWLLHKKNSHFRVSDVLGGLTPLFAIAAVALVIMWTLVMMLGSPFDLIENRTLTALMELIFYALVLPGVALGLGALVRNRTVLFFTDFLLKPLRKPKTASS